MKKYLLKTQYKKRLADTITPVSAYLKIRDKFPNSILLESTDYRANDNSFSYLCCNPIASIKIENHTVYTNYPDGSSETKPIEASSNIPKIIQDFSSQFKMKEKDFKFITNGLFGYLSYDALQYLNDVTISKKENSISIPELNYHVYQNIIAMDHFQNEMYIFCHSLDGQDNIEEIEQILQAQDVATYRFNKQGEGFSNLTDEEFKVKVSAAKSQCEKGLAHQLVLSRRFSQGFTGDEFNVYRALRSINPSPYLFFFDYGNFKIFGSSPEAQIIVKNRKAEIHPIAGTYKRTGNDEQDTILAKKLSEDKKENDEHNMLVELAKSDLSRNGKEVKVEAHKRIQFFSHVIHLVSKVTAQLHEDTLTMQLVADTFPAGTLSGTPKKKAVEWIEENEKTNRGYYGGAIGFLDFEGNFNHAIMIRTFLSKDHLLHSQAGAGVIASSNEDAETEEVYNKLRALNKALDLAEQI